MQQSFDNVHLGQYTVIYNGGTKKGLGKTPMCAGLGSASTCFSVLLKRALMLKFRPK